MTTLSEAWDWYQTTLTNLRLLERLAKKHWNRFPDDSEIWSDDHLRSVSAKALAEGAVKSLGELDSLAIIVLFSLFEAQIRTRLLGDIREEKDGLRHPVLRSAARDATDSIDRGSFYKVLSFLKSLDHDIVEQVRQVRRYRNWISHGKRGNPPARVTPRAAYDRLSALLRALETVPPRS